MTADDRLEIRTYLEERLEYLQGRDLNIEVNLLPDENEYASMLSEIHFNVVMREREGRELGQVERALKRLRDPDYGICQECGESIGLARLKARPETSLCVHCQSELEQVAA